MYQLALQALRMTARDWRAGELRLLAAALVLAIAAVTSVGFLVDRIGHGLQRDARQLLGADLVLSSDRPIDDTLRARAARAGVHVADTVTFPSMALNAAHSELNTLVALKAVAPAYPLRGALRVQSDPSAADEPAQGIPAPGTAWVDAQVMGALHLRVGEPLKLGERVLVVTRLIVIEPDRGAQFINLAPRVLINLADLPATALIQPGSRVTYRLLVAGDDAAMQTFTAWLQDNLQRGQRVESIEGGRPEVQRTLERAHRFLALVALLAALVAAVAVASAARRFSLRHLDSCATMRCLGLAQRDIFRLFAGEFVIIGVAACVLGTVLGLIGHFALLSTLRSFLPGDLPTPSLLPAAQGLACGLVLLLGFALPPLAQLRAVPPLRVLRKDLGLPTAGSALGFALGGVAFFLLLLWAANDVRIGLLVAGGFAGGILLFATVAALVLRSLRSLRAMTGRLGMSWRFAIAAIQRR